MTDKLAQTHAPEGIEQEKNEKDSCAAETEPHPCGRCGHSKAAHIVTHVNDRFSGYCIVGSLGPDPCGCPDFLLVGKRDQASMEPADAVKSEAQRLTLLIASPHLQE